MDGSVALRLRVASKADLSVVKALRDALYAESPSPPWRDESWDTYAEEITQIVHAGGAFLAERRGETVGLALAWLEGPNAVQLGDLYVAPEYRGEGIGSALVRAVAELARSRGAVYVHLMANLDALAFYDRLAFREESRNLVTRVDTLLSQ